MSISFYKEYPYVINLIRDKGILKNRSIVYTDLMFKFYNQEGCLCISEQFLKSIWESNVCEFLNENITRFCNDFSDFKPSILVNDISKTLKIGDVFICLSLVGFDTHVTYISLHVVHDRCDMFEQIISEVFYWSTIQTWICSMLKVEIPTKAWLQGSISFYVFNAYMYPTTLKNIKNFTDSCKNYELVYFQLKNNNIENANVFKKLEVL